MGQRLSQEIHEHRGIPINQLLERGLEQREGKPQRRQRKLNMKDEEMKGRDTTQKTKQEALEG